MTLVLTEFGSFQRKKIVKIAWFSVFLIEKGFEKIFVFRFDWLLKENRICNLWTFFVKQKFWLLTFTFAMIFHLQKFPYFWIIFMIFMRVIVRPVSVFDSCQTFLKCKTRNSYIKSILWIHIMFFIIFIYFAERLSCNVMWKIFATLGIILPHSAIKTLWNSKYLLKHFWASELEI